MKEGRRLGGLRRRREGTLAAAYDVEHLADVQDLRRLLEIATLDTLNLDNSVARNRVLIAAVLAAAKLLELGDIAARLEMLEFRIIAAVPEEGIGPQWLRR